MSSAIAWYKPQNGGWLASSGECTAYGRTLERARQAIVEELAKATRTLPGRIVLRDEVAISEHSQRLLAGARDARAAALRAAHESNEATAMAARALEAEGLSLRDTAYLLGISHTRVHQLLGAT